VRTGLRGEIFMAEVLYGLLALLAFGLFVGALLLGPISFFRLGALRKRLAFAEGRILELRGQISDLRAQLRVGAQPPHRDAEGLDARPDETRTSAPLAPAPAEPAPRTEPEIALPLDQSAEATVSAEGLAASEAEPLHAPVEPPRIKPSRSLEEALGAQWTVWVGGVALALGALLLVRYSIDQGWFGAAARIAAGLLFAAALAIAGEYLRRKETALSQISAVLTAAGTVSAFGSIYAAHALYGFIGPSFAFIALGATGLACMAAAALHGPALAGLGLVGALTAPLLVQSSEPSVWPLVIYVTIVTACSYGLVRVKFWLWLAVTAAVGGLLWGLALIDQSASQDQPVFHATLIFIIAQTFMAALLFAIVRHASTLDEDARIDRLPIYVLSAFGLLMLMALSDSANAGHFGLAWGIAASASVAILAASGGLAAPAAGLAPAAGAMVIAVMAIWPGAAGEALPDSSDLLSIWLKPREVGGFSVFSLMTAFGVAALAGARLLRGPKLRSRIAALYAGAASLTPLAALGIAYLRLSHGDLNWPFAAYAGGLALVFTFAATVISSRLESEPSEVLRLSLGAYASAALAALALGLVFALDRGVLTIALALAALSAAFVDRRLDISALRWCVAGLGLVVAARLVWEPRIVSGDLGATPIFNWLLWGYGVPALAFSLAGQLLRRKAVDAPALVAQALSIFFSAFLVFFEIRHWINGGDPYARGSGLVEQGLFATAAFGFSIVLTRFDATRTNVVLRFASLGFGVLSFGFALFGLLLCKNPVFSGEAVEGGTVFNTMPLAYGVPAVLAAVLAKAAQGVRPNWYRNGAELAAFSLIFVLANLEIRRIFQGPDMSFFADGGSAGLRPASDSELYSYSALWLMFGLISLGYGLWRGSVKARIASAALIVATVLKVFLFDLSSLEGALRALSFIGLGLVLLGIGLVYQKFIFARRTAPT